MLPHCPALLSFSLLLIVTVVLSHYYGQINDDDEGAD